MEPASLIEIIRLVLSMAIIPAVLWGWQTKKELSDLKYGQRDIKESNSKEHAIVITELKELSQRIVELEKQNQAEHSAFNDRLHKIDTDNKIEHVILGIRKDAAEDCNNH